MTPRDWLVLFAAYRGAPDGLDPVRFQKGLFLFSRVRGVPERSKYRFKPCSYGPMSDGVYADLDRLVGEGLIEPVSVPGKHWSRYKPTDVTFREGERVLKRAEDEHLLGVARELYEIKREVSSLGFDQLLGRIYDKHPEFAVKSVFRASA